MTGLTAAAALKRGGGGWWSHIQRRHKNQLWLTQSKQSLVSQAKYNRCNCLRAFLMLQIPQLIVHLDHDGWNSISVDLPC